MYKIINILLFIGLLNTSIFAKITKEDVNKYIEVSRGGAIIKYSLTTRYKACFSMMYGMNIKKADKSMMKKYKSFIFHPKYEKLFYETFTRLDENSYYEIMEFYKTNLGKKYAKSFKELFEMDIGRELTTLILKNKDNIVLSKKRKLVIQIENVLYGRKYIDVEKNNFVKSYGGVISEYSLDSNESVLKTVGDEYFKVFSEIAYRDFSDEELLQVLEYAKTYGKIEMGVLHHALELNRESFKKDLKEFINKKTASK